ncbi:MAG: TVP38/TMEM64 family protein [Hyphomonadaceae bacterium]
MVGLLVAAVAAYFLLGLNRYLTLDKLRSNAQSLRQFTNDHRLPAIAAFLATYIAVVALSVPGATFMTIAGGLLFGLWLGAALNILAATTGAIILFVIARFVLSGMLQAGASAFIARMEDGFARNAFTYLMFLRLVPLFPFWAVNLAAAAFRTPLRSFALATLIGIIPGTLAFTSIGDGLSLAAGASSRGPNDEVLGPAMIALRIGLALLALVPVLVTWLRKRRAR